MQPTPFLPFAAALLALGASFPSSMARPDEGMWLFDALPLQTLKEKYGFEPSQEWVDHVRLGSVRFDTGGSGSFVSPNGLVMTNHHVALETIQKVSTPEKDFVELGFSAKQYGQEVPGKDLTLRQLIEIKNVTQEIHAAAKDGKDEAEKSELRRAKLESLTAAASDAEKHIVADAVTLYDGNEFRIYVYHVYDDVRVVWAPEKQVAFYGGDLDNFTYPRWCLDCAFFRVYEDGKPVDSSKFYFKWNPEGAKADDLVFVSGHPGNTERLLTHAEMELHRDLSVPAIVRLLEQRAQMMKRRMDADKQAAFQLRDQYFGVMNSLKAYSGHLAGLRDVEMMTKMAARDAELVEKSGKPEVAAAFEFIAAEMQKLREAHGGEQVDLRKLMPAMQQVTMQTCADAKKTINDARFAVYGTALYPDATFTLRLAFGTVKGYEAGTTAVAPKTTLHGLYERNAAFDNAHPFDLPQRWLDKKGELNLNTAYNFVCTADIIGGNSGSPILNRAGEVVGLVFDGNIESLPGNYWFDERVNRCVGVHTAGMTEAMVKVYGEVELANELLGK
jgi:hypothetical protein